MTSVTSSSVIAPPERFLHVADDTLLQFFQSGCTTDEEAGQMAMLHAMLEGLSQHDFAQRRKRLQGDFAHFAGGSGGMPAAQPAQRYGAESSRPGAAPHRQTSGSLLAKEQRFLSDFQDLMGSAHYRLLSLEEWEAASSEEFLFSLPVAVNWQAMDDQLLRRHWLTRPREREELPPLADRVLIWHRGVTRARMSGRYWGTKVELLASFLLLQPLYNLLVFGLRTLGISAPPPPPLPHAGPGTPRSFKGVGLAAGAAMRFKKAASAKRGQQQQLGEAGLQHEARVLVERRTLNRCFPNARAVLRQFFRRVELQEACFSDVVVLYRRAAGTEGGLLQTGEEGDVPSRHNIALRHFRGIPLADLELIMPEKTIYVPPSVLIQLLAAVAVALVGLVATAFQAELNLKVWGSAFLLLASRASGVYFQAQSERSEIEREMNRLLLERLAASQEAVLHTLTEEVCRQRIRELLVCYCVLRAAGGPLGDDALDAKCERLLRREFGLALDFTAEAAIPKLLAWGLLERDGAGTLVARPLGEGLRALDARWDALFCPAQFGGDIDIDGPAGQHAARRPPRPHQLQQASGAEQGREAAEGEEGKKGKGRREAASVERAAQERECIASAWLAEVGRGAAGAGTASSSTSREEYVVLRTPIVPTLAKPPPCAAATCVASASTSPTRKLCAAGAAPPRPSPGKAAQLLRASSLKRRMLLGDR